MLQHTKVKNLQCSFLPERFIPYWNKLPTEVKNCLAVLSFKTRLEGFKKVMISKCTGWAKSQFTYVGLNSSVTECSFEIILSGMTDFHHWFEEFVKSKHICVHFFQMTVHFRIYLIVWIVGSSQILFDCVWPFELRFY